MRPRGVDPLVAVVPIGGYAGWRFLSATLDTQVQRMAESPLQARDRDYFRENIGNVVTASQLVRRFPPAPRGAERVRTAGRSAPTGPSSNACSAMAPSSPRLCRTGLRTNDTKRFPRRSAFGGPLPPRTLSPGFADKVLARFDRQEFERSVGAQDEDLRLALTASRELPELAARGLPDTTVLVERLGQPAAPPRVRDRAGPARVGRNTRPRPPGRRVPRRRDTPHGVLGCRTFSRNPRRPRSL